MLASLKLVQAIVAIGYRKTGDKFSVEFSGSKGYLSHVEIYAEGTQTKRNNIIWVSDLRTKKGTLKSKKVSIFHSVDNGVRVEVQGYPNPDW